MYRTESDLLNEFDSLINDIGVLKEEKEVCIESIQSLTNEFEKEFPDTCPLCGDLNNG